MNTKAFAIAGLTAVALSLTACSASSAPSDSFKDSCDKVNGTVQQENDSLGMGALEGFKPKPRSASKPRVSKPKAAKPYKPGKAAPPVKPGKKKHSSSSSDNDWQCVKDGVVLFEED
jgi:hypothetical protein